jgi:hypothetical protein
MFRRQDREPEPWALAAGAAAGAGAVAFAVLQGIRMLRRRQRYDTGVPVLPVELEALEDSAVEMLRRDPETGTCAIDVAAIAPGIVELTGYVPTHDIGQRAARVLHSLPGVRTVISRLEVGSFEARLADARGRHARGEPETLERRWYGVRVGTGRRRQSPDTDPPRTDDSRDLLSRDLEVRDADLDDAAPVPGAGDDSDATNRPM